MQGPEAQYLRLETNYAPSERPPLPLQSSLTASTQHTEETSIVTVVP